MSYVQRELDRIHIAICDPAYAERRAELYAAQQALSWALEPTGFRTPYGAILGIEAATEGYPAEPHPTVFSDIRAPAASAQ